MSRFSCAYCTCERHLSFRRLDNPSNAWERLAYMCDSFGGRLSGSAALERSLDYIATTARADGLNVVEEPVDVPKWTRGEEWARLITPTRTKELRIAGLGESVATPNGAVLRAPILVVSSFDDLAAKNATGATAGKIIVYNWQEWTGYGPTVQFRYLGADKAKQVGGVAALVRSVTPFSIQTPHTGASKRTEGCPSAAITVEDALLLARLQARGQTPLEIELLMSATLANDTSPSRNIIIDVRGSEFPDEFVVIGGHIDSWDIAEGAMDDGGGAFAGWEAIRMIHVLGLKPRRTIRSVMWVNEENGGQGGKKYAEDHRGELAKTSLAIESDAGAWEPNKLGFTGSDAAFEIMRRLGADGLGAIDAGEVSRGGGGSDIDPMCRTGVPCAELNPRDPRDGPAGVRSTGAPMSQANPCSDMAPAVAEGTTGMTLGQRGGSIPDGYFWYHHTAADTPDKIDPEQLQRSAAFMAIYAFSVAQLDDLLPRGSASAAGGGGGGGDDGPMPYALGCMPSAYYAGVLEGLAAGEAPSRERLHALVAAQKNVIPYTAKDGQTDVWAALSVLDQAPWNASRVLPIYSRLRPQPATARNHGRGTGWNREHVWPRSFGVGSSGPDSTDLHMLFAADSRINSARSNKWFDDVDCATAAAEDRCRTPATAGADPSTAATADAFMPPASMRGDLARALLFGSLRYDGKEPQTEDLELGDAPNRTTFRMGKLSALLRWHAADPVDAGERTRNDLICARYQGNRNPFVDHPEYVAKVMHLRTFSGLAGTSAGAGDQCASSKSSLPSAKPLVALVAVLGVLLAAAVVAIFRLKKNTPASSRAVEIELQAVARTANDMAAPAAAAGEAAPEYVAPVYEKMDDKNGGAASPPAKSGGGGGSGSSEISAI